MAKLTTAIIMGLVLGALPTVFAGNAATASIATVEPGGSLLGLIAFTTIGVVGLATTFLLLLRRTTLQDHRSLPWDESAGADLEASNVSTSARSSA